MTLLGISIDVRLEHPENAKLPMFVTLLGIVVFLQPNNIVLRAVSIMALQLLRESYLGLPPSTIMEVRPLHAWKAPSSMDFTLLGIVMDVRPEHPIKAFLPIEVTLLGMVIEFRPSHFQKTSFPMLVTL